MVSNDRLIFAKIVQCLPIALYDTGTSTIGKFEGPQQGREGAFESPGLQAFAAARVKLCEGGAPAPQCC